VDINDNDSNHDHLENSVGNQYYKIIITWISIRSISPSSSSRTIKIKIQILTTLVLITPILTNT